ncbi:T9SS-dependent choice-of-anchor J family protein [Limnovirga soli]|uniref:T9SS type A sorting domain-containing protein n=1 Tax=Limnovirga soli TaxID=2656915 RepID=A0A8J8FFV9_9BACT|nr:choice-of-anchor J domain-containing protein [Limnovirga soli]NNV57148.1 T9SS type A sorting domain-containing protein [Limnovirga soli]
MRKRSLPLYCSRFIALMAFFVLLSAATMAQLVTGAGFENAKVPAQPVGWVVTNTNNAQWQSLEAIGYDGNEYAGNKCMYLEKSYYGDQSDAWLISPAFTLEAGKKYSISFYYKNQSYLENDLQVTLGDDTLPAAQTKIIWSSNFKTNYYSKAQVNYTATKTGTVYLGFHAITPATYTYMYIDNFKVEAVNCFEPLEIEVNKTKVNGASFSWQNGGSSNRYEYGVSNKEVPPANTSFTDSSSLTLTTLSTATPYYLYVRSVCGKGVYSNWAVKAFTTDYDTAGIATLECGTKFENNFLAKPGLYLQPFCGDVFFGGEFFHKFIPAETGMYTLNAYSVNTGQQMVYGYKDATLGAGPDGWTCIGNSFGNRQKISFGPLQAGKTYLILEKAKAAPKYPSSYKYGIDCPTTNTLIQSASSAAIATNSSVKMQVYPNPVADKLTLTVTETKACRYQISLTGMGGNVLSSFAKDIANGSNQILINMANVRAGMYILKIQTPSGTQYQKIIKQ